MCGAMVPPGGHPHHVPRTGQAALTRANGTLPTDTGSWPLVLPGSWGGVGPAPVTSATWADNCGLWLRVGSVARSPLWLRPTRCSGNLAWEPPPVLRGPPELTSGLRLTPPGPDGKATCLGTQWGRGTERSAAPPCAPAQDSAGATSSGAPSLGTSCRAGTRSTWRPPRSTHARPLGRDSCHLRPDRQWACSSLDSHLPGQGLVA